MPLHDIEIMSPVGSYESLMAAIQGGAGSVYFGVGKLNMRARSSVNFTLDDLAKITRICRQFNVKSYLTMNTVIFDHEIEEVHRTIDAAKHHGVTAIIASDLSVLEYAKEQGVEIHISTQCNITNISAVKFYSRYADVMVTARELTLDQVAAITRQIREQNIRGPKGELIKIEIFVHGALCMAVSGKCYLSLHNHNTSANRGACLQDCRRSYTVKDKESDVELEIDNEYIMSAKDLCTIDFLDQILATGVNILKIEGRGRAADYVYTTTKCYREAIDAYQAGTYSAEKAALWKEELSTVFNRGFWGGYFLGKEMGEWSEVYGSKATLKKIYVGKGVKYFNKLGVAEFILETDQLSVGNPVMITGPTTGIINSVVEELRVADEVVETVRKGQSFSMKIPEVVRASDKLYKVIAANDQDLTAAQ